MWGTNPCNFAKLQSRQAIRQQPQYWDDIPLHSFWFLTGYMIGNGVYLNQACLMIAIEVSLGKLKAHKISDRSLLISLILSLPPFFSPP